MKNQGIDFFLTKDENGDIRGQLAMDNYLKTVSPGRYTVNIKKYKKSRGLNQNAYYWKIVINFVRDGLLDMGFEQELLSTENVHEMLKAKFLSVDIANENGEFITMVKSTTELTYKEFEEYVENIQRWAAEFLSIVIPDRGEQSDMFQNQ